MPRFVGLLGLGFALLAGCESKVTTSPAPSTATTSAGSSGGNTNYQPGGGAIQNARQAAKRTEVLNEMRTLGQLIEIAFNDFNKMPTKEQIMMGLQKDAPKVHAMISNGTIILTGTMNHSGLWAYEVDSETLGGVGLVGGTPNRYRADEIKSLLASR